MSSSLSLPEGVIVSSRQSLRQTKKRNVFHLQVPEKKELLKWQSGQEFHFTVKKTVEWKYWMQLSVPYPTPRSPFNSPAISNNKVNTSLDRNPTAVKNKHDQLQQSFSLLCLSPVFQLSLYLSHSLTPNQSYVIRQLHQLY